MKIPSGETPDNSTSNGDGYTSDDFDHLDHIEMAPAPIRDGDFSEYMWMENEEEFNSQVLRELEEQELMEECMAAMLGDSPNEENESQSGEYNHAASNSRTSTDSYSSPSFNGLSESVNNLSLSSNGVRNNSSDSFNNSHSQSPSNTSHYSAQSRLNRIRPSDNSRSNSAAENGSKFTLNPDAKEFVPSSPRAAATLSNSEEEKVPS